MNHNDIIIVSGLPRSGTSLMMQMLRASGVPVTSDDLRPPDEDNPNGYFELESVKRLRAGSSTFLAELAGTAVKIVAPLLRELPRGNAYRVIFMQRGLLEVIESQRVMLERRGMRELDPDIDVMAALRCELARVNDWLASRDDIAVLHVNYCELVASPLAEAGRINAFLGGHLDVAAMAATVDPALYRRRGDGNLHR